MKKLFAALALAALAACGGNNPPPQPWPTPTPTPTPEPPAVAVRTDMLLRTSGGKLFNLAGEPQAIFGFYQCCMEPPAGVTNSRWPGISEEMMNYALPYGANWFGIRMGPFYGDPDHEIEWSDVGGGYVAGPGSAFNEAFFDEVEKLVKYAADHNSYMEINVVDTWYCKHAQWGDQQMPWSEAAIQACGRTPGNAEEEAWIRKVVSRLTKYGNVVWLTDNEGSEISGDNRAWFAWVRDVIRNEESKDPSGHVHIIGTNSQWTDVGDYVATHSKAPLGGPINGRWTINNERNPTGSPGQEAANFKLARDNGQAYAYWRAGHSEAEMVDTLQRFQAVAGGGNVACYAPAGDDPNWGEPVAGGTPELRDAVKAATQRVGDRCGVSKPEMYETLELVAEELRKAGYCASKADDAVLVRQPSDKTKFQEFHVVAFTTGCYSTNLDVLPKNTWPYKGSSGGGGGTACTPPEPPGQDRWGLKIHNVGPNWTTVDATPLVKDSAYCAQVGFPGNQVCPLRAEDDPSRAACESVVVGGDPIWSGPGEVSPEGPYLYRVRRGTGGTVTVCNHSGVCGSIEVQP